MKEDDLADGTGLPGPGLRFEVKNEVGVAGGRLIDIEKPGMELKPQPKFNF
jgi:hypothetical protein